jgi:predicted GIY-YIG superfamily endonuclease
MAPNQNDADITKAAAFAPLAAFSFQPMEPAKMMIKPISHYDEKRKKPARASTRGPGTRSEFLVYIARPVGGDLHKVGYTSDMSRRLLSYESASGQDFEVRLQFVAASKEDAKGLEKQMISALSSRCERRKSEWFLATNEDLVGAVGEVSKASTKIVAIRGGITNVQDKYDAHKRAVSEASKLSKGYSGLNHGRIL